MNVAKCGWREHKAKSRAARHTYSTRSDKDAILALGVRKGQKGEDERQDEVNRFIACFVTGGPATSWFQGQTLAEASGLEYGRFMREGSTAYHSEGREKKAAKVLQSCQRGNGPSGSCLFGGQSHLQQSPNAKSSSPISRCSLHHSWAMKRFSRYMRAFPSFCGVLEWHTLSSS
jgi:hypothetical protein